MKTRVVVERALLVAGFALVAWGAYLPAKAALAQVLLQDAWARAKSGAVSPKPWPWADTFPVAHLSVPALDVDVIALEGGSGRTLAFGPGHVEQSAPPESDGHVVLAGHRDTHFRFLKDLVRGDVVHLEDKTGRSRAFIVEGGRVTHETDASVLAARDGLTLVTCWPFDAVVPGGPGRYVVRARPVETANALERVLPREFIALNALIDDAGAR